MKTLLFALGAAALVAGCVNVYESNSETPIDCEETHDVEQLDDGATTPIRCTLEENATSNASSGS